MTLHDITWITCHYMQNKMLMRVTQAAWPLPVTWSWLGWPVTSGWQSWLGWQRLLVTIWNLADLRNRRPDLRYRYMTISWLKQVVATAPKRCPDFSSESIFAGIFYLENHLISSLNDYCKRKETSQNGRLESSRLVWLRFRPSRITGLHLHSNLKLMCCRTPARRGRHYLDWRCYLRYRRSENDLRYRVRYYNSISTV